MWYDVTSHHDVTSRRGVKFNLNDVNIAESRSTEYVNVRVLFRRGVWSSHDNDRWKTSETADLGYGKFFLPRDFTFTHVLSIMLYYYMSAPPDLTHPLTHTTILSMSFRTFI